MVKTKDDVDISDGEEGQKSIEEDCSQKETGSILNLLLLYNLDFLIQEIFLLLDFVSLHTMRQVNKEWNMYIKERVWFSSKGRKFMERKLATQWRLAEPHKTCFYLEKRGFYLAVDDTEVGLGTLDNEALVLGSQGPLRLELECQDPKLAESNDFVNFEGLSEALSIQLDMTETVIVTVTGCGVVTVWDRRSGENLYRAAHHGYEPVLGVRVVGDLVVTGGIHGSLAVLSLKPSEPRVVLESLVTDRDQTSINHLDSDGKMILVGTDNDMRLWQVDQRRGFPVVATSVPAKHVCCCVLFYPFAASTGLFANYGIQVWNLETGEMLRHLHTNLSMWVVQIKNNILATSMSGEMNDSRTPLIFLHDVEELVDPSIANKSLWSREIVCAREDLNDPHIAINTTKLYAVTKSGGGGAKVTSWDFWSYSQPVHWDKDTFLQDISPACVLNQ